MPFRRDLSTALAGRVSRETITLVYTAAFAQKGNAIVVRRTASVAAKRTEK
jgi:molybdenum cofactor biosynthesis enzyme